jgi:primosomal protein N' (replication factor Y) (superfamily II helicase)
MSELFPTEQPDPARPPGEERVVAIAVNANLWGRFDYLWPDGLGEPFTGQRVRVPFGRGNRMSLAFVVDADAAAEPGRKLKPVAKVIDTAPALDETLMELGRWISHYYLAPLGATLAAMVPAAVGSEAPKRETVVWLRAEPDDWPGNLGAKQRTVLDELLEARRQGIEPLTLEQLTHHANASRDTIRRLIQRELIRTDIRDVVLGRDETPPDEPNITLNADQQAALDSLTPGLRQGGFAVNLLHGVTGSGKTEVYIRAIREVAEQDKQVILLTPEIALATQTFQRLLRRLPRVVVLHSGLTAARRAFAWQQIRDGHASVVVGPRSAVFAPTRNLGLVIVDEEHEGSYKQDTAPRYHGRDVAIKRASLADVPVLLGSATPSLESYHNARAGKYTLLRLPHRVQHLPMPSLQIVHLRKDLTPGRVELLGNTLTAQMARSLDRDEQIILLMNRRGYASYVFCPSCKWMKQCDDCMLPMVWHRATQLCVCHHCDRTEALPDICPACDGKIVLFGYGIQRIEDEIGRKFPTARLARMDSDTMTSPKQFQQVLDDFGAGKVDILLGTQMVAKGLDFPRVSLVGVVSADTALSLHDFRAAERTFQLIVQVAGRAGRADIPGSVVVQTLHPDDPAIRYAEGHDYNSFAAGELQERIDANLPPACRMTRLIVRHTDIETTRQGAEELAIALRNLIPAEQATVIGPLQAELAKIRSHYRFHLLILSAPGVVQNALEPAMARLAKEIKADFQADPDPLNLM